MKRNDGAARYDSAVPVWEYTRATWDEVIKLGPQGWRLIAVPPVQEVRQVLGQPQVGEPLYTMEREHAAGWKPEEIAERMGLSPLLADSR